jgi:hypothetical protein
MNLSRNILFLSMVLLLAVPQASSSSIWRETETGQDELASPQHIISTSNAGAATNAARTSFERSSDIIADEKIIRRQVKKADKNSKRPVFVEAKPSLTKFCGPSPNPLPCSCSAPPVSDGTATTLNDMCPACAGETTTASNLDMLRTAPTPTCSALGYKALLRTSISIPSVDCLSTYLQEAAAAKTAASGIAGTSEADFDQVMIDFCVHQCSQEYWDGLASELGLLPTNDDVNAFILDTCKPSFPLHSDTSCVIKTDSCTNSVYTAVGDDSCDGYISCKNSEYSTIGKTACLGYRACYEVDNCNVGDISCDGYDSCTESEYSTIGKTACQGRGACFEVKNFNVGDESCDGTDSCKQSEYSTIGKTACHGFTVCSEVDNFNVGDNSCVSAWGACMESVYVTIGKNSCLANNACSQIAGTSFKPVKIGDGACTEEHSCKYIKVDVFDGSCTYAGSCSCAAITTNFPGGVPPTVCVT